MAFAAVHGEIKTEQIRKQHADLRFFAHDAIHGASTADDARHDQRECRAEDVEVQNVDKNNGEKQNVLFQTDE